MNPPLLTTEQSVDPVFWYIVGISAFFLVLIVAIMIVFLVRYNRRRHPVPTSQVSQNVTLEVLWTLIPTVLALSMFYYGWSGYLNLRRVPEGAMEVSVTGRMWSWLFEYANGKTSDKLYVPTGRPVKVKIHSADVIHSFYIPAFRVKRDAVPGMETEVWFTATHPGSYDIFCAEYCGVGHAAMITTVEALPEHEFNEWYAGEAPEGEAEEGMKLLRKHGCIGCHSLDGSPSVGPTFKGIWGRQVTVVADGKERTVKADEAYLKRAILDPQADLVKGFPPVMPSYRDRMSGQEVEEIVEHFRKAAGGGETTGLSGEKVARDKGCIGCHSADGSRMVGPTFKGLFGRQVTVLRKGGPPVTVQADDDYLRRAITDPGAEIVQGYPPVMPAFKDLTEAETGALLEYIKGLK